MNNVKKIILTASLLLCAIDANVYANINPTHHKAVVVGLASEININTANASQLMSLKGVGEKKAAAIIAYRKENGRFSTIDDLIKVKGISKKALASIEKKNPNRLRVK